MTYALEVALAALSLFGVALIIDGVCANRADDLASTRKFKGACDALKPSAPRGGNYGNSSRRAVPTPSPTRGVSARAARRGPSLRSLDRLPQGAAPTGSASSVPSASGFPRADGTGLVRPYTLGLVKK